MPGGRCVTRRASSVARPLTCRFVRQALPRTGPQLLGGVAGIAQRERPTLERPVDRGSPGVDASGLRYEERQTWHTKRSKFGAIVRRCRFRRATPSPIPAGTAGRRHPVAWAAATRSRYPAWADSFGSPASDADALGLQATSADEAATDAAGPVSDEHGLVGAAARLRSGDSGQHRRSRSGVRHAHRAPCRPDRAASRCE